MKLKSLISGLFSNHTVFHKIKETPISFSTMILIILKTASGFGCYTCMLLFYIIHCLYNDQDGVQYPSVYRNCWWLFMILVSVIHTDGLQISIFKDLKNCKSMFIFVVIPCTSSTQDGIPVSFRIWETNS